MTGDRSFPTRLIVHSRPGKTRHGLTFGTRRGYPEPIPPSPHSIHPARKPAMSAFRSPATATLFVLAAAVATFGQEPIAVRTPEGRSTPVSYSDEIVPILESKCLGCHGAALAENRLDMESVAAMLKGGKRGPALVAGKADASLIFQMAAHRIEPVMPPRDKKDHKPLSPDELGLLKLWIDAGANDDADPDAEGSPTIELGPLPASLRPIGAVDLNADGSRVAVGRADAVQVYDVDSGLPIRTLGGHRDLVQAVRFSPDGSRLAAGSYRIVTVWDAPTGAEQKSISGHDGAIVAVRPLPNGRILSMADDRTVRVWDPAAGTEIARIDLPGPKAQALAVSQDGRFVAVGSDDSRIRVWTLEDRQPFASLEAGAGPVLSLAFLNGQRKIVAGLNDGPVRVWTLPESANGPVVGPVVLAGHQGAVRAVAGSPDGAAIASGGDDRTIRFWDSADGKASRVIEAQPSAVRSIAFDPRGGRIAAGCDDHSARTFDTQTGATLHTLLAHAKPVVAVAYSPTGERLATAGADGASKVWETDSGQGVIAFGRRADPNQPPQPLAGVAFLDANRIVTGSADRTLRTWSFQGTWTLRNTLGPHQFRILALDFHPDGNLLAVGGGEPSRSGEVKLWELPRGALVYSLDQLHSDTVLGVRFSPNGLYLATGSADRFLKVVKITDTRAVRSFEGHTHHVMGVDWKSDGTQLVSAGADQVLKIWDAATGDQSRTLRAAGKQITSVRWLPGKSMIAGASGDHLVRLWNPDNGEILRAFPGAGDYVFAVDASDDGRRLAAGGADGMLFVWRADDAQVIARIAP